MRIKYTFIGIPIFSLEILKDDITADDVAQIVSNLTAAPAEEEEVEERSQFGWGHSPHLERDANARFPEDRYTNDDKWADRPFGFARPVDTM